MAIVHNFHRIYKATEDQCLEPFVASYFKGASRNERKEIVKDLSQQLKYQSRQTLLESRIDSVPQSYQTEMLSLINQVGKIEEGSKVKNDFRNRKLWAIGGLVATGAAVALVVLGIFMAPLAAPLYLGAIGFGLFGFSFFCVSLSKHIQYRKQIELISKTAINGLIFLAQFSTTRDPSSNEINSTLPNTVNMKRLLSDQATKIGSALTDYLDKKASQYT